MRPAVLQVLAAMLLLLAGPVNERAQAQPAVLPPAAEPDIRLEQMPAERAAPPPPIEVPASAPSRAPSGADKIRFILTGIEVEGVTAFPLEVIHRLYADSIGTELSLAQVYDIAAAIQRLYRDADYFLTRVILPPQTTTEGRLTIKVIEGFVSDIQLEGAPGPVKEKALAYLENIKKERPLRLKTLQRYLLLTRDLPGIKTKGILRPAPEQIGAAQLIVSLERVPVDAAVLFDNLGSSFTGEWELTGSSSFNSFSSMGERFTLTGLLSDPWKGLSESSENQKVVQMSTSVRPGSQGAYVNLIASYGKSNPGGDISDFEFDSKKLLVSIVGGYPLILSQDRSLKLELGFDYSNSDTDIYRDVTYSKDRLRVLHLSAYADFFDRWRGFTTAALQLRQGLPIFNASEAGDPFLSRADGVGDFTSVRAEVSRWQPVIGNFSFYGTLAAQYAFDDLLSDEEFDIGGLRFGRGYNPKEVSGDNGIGFTGELRYNVMLDGDYLDNLQVFGFYDGGSVHDRETSESTFIASAGGGVRVWLLNNISADLQVAKPLNHDSERAGDGRNPEILFRATAHF